MKTAIDMSAFSGWNFGIIDVIGVVSSKFQLIDRQFAPAAHMETFVWWVDPAHLYLREEWKCATTTSGGQCVMTHGTTLMPMWHVDS